MRELPLGIAQRALTHDPTHRVTGNAIKNYVSDGYTMTDAILFTAVNSLLADIDSVTGLDLLAAAQALEAAFGPGALMSRFVGFVNPGFDLNAGTSLLAQLISAGGGSGNTIADFANLFTAVGMSAEEIAALLFSVPGGDLDLLGDNLMALLGNPNLNVPTGFDPITTASESMLQNVLTPAGALTSWTRIPAHLFGNVAPGRPTDNLLPDPGFDDPSVVNGQTLWFHDQTVGRTTPLGSIRTAAGSVLRQMKGVPITTKPGQESHFEVWTQWTGVTAGTGDAIALVANAYDANDNIIANPTGRVIQAITNPTTNSSGWQQLSGDYIAPAGTVYVRIGFEVTATVSAGMVWFDDAFHSLIGIIDASYLGNIENIPKLLATSVDGYQGISDMLQTLIRIFDGLGTSFSLEPITDVTPPQLFGLAQSTAERALAAYNDAVSAIQILGTRTNKPGYQGLNATSEATFPLAALSAPAGSSLTAVAAGTALQGLWRASEDARKGFLEFMAQGNGGTNIFVNAYQTNPNTGARTNLWASPDLGLLVPNGSLNYVRALIPGNVQPDIGRGETFFLEIVNAGTGTLSVVTNNYGTPNNSSEVIPNFAGTRSLAGTGGAQPASLTAAQVTATAVAPYVNFGIANVPAGYLPPDLDIFTSSGTYVVPTGLMNGDLIDFFVLASGGGGQGSQSGVFTSGGEAGNWQVVTMVYGSDINSTGYPVLPATTTTLAITINNPGSGGGAVFLSPGGNGGNAVVSGAGITTITAIGGRGGANGWTGSGTNGEGAGDQSRGGYTAFGGDQVGINADGSPPGGGGGSGYNANGRPGAKGKVWTRFRGRT